MKWEHKCETLKLTLKEYSDNFWRRLMTTDKAWNNGEIKAKMNDEKVNTGTPEAGFWIAVGRHTISDGISTLMKTAVISKKSLQQFSSPQINNAYLGRQ